MTSDVKTLDRGGAALRYADTGSGDPALVFVHGWTCDRTHWRYQVPLFAQDHRTVALDLPGHGESDAPDQDYTIAGYADDVEALIEDLSLERPVIIGHSMGGMITLSLARANPDIARGIVLIDPALAPPPEALQPMVESVFAGLQGPAYDQFARGFINTFMFNEDSDPQLKEELIQGMLRTPQPVIISALTSLIEEMSRPGGSVPVPALMLRASTNIVPTEDIKQKYPGIEVREIEGAHFLQVEHPDEVNAAIKEFLAGP